MKPIQIISQDVFDKIRSRFSNLEMGDETGAVTIDPAEARFFDFDFVIEGNNLGRVSISLNDLGSLKVYYSQGITENQDDPAKKEWYSFLKEMRFFAMRRLLRFDTRDIAKTNLDKNDFQHLAATQGPKEEPDMNTMNESRWNKKSSKKTSRAVQGKTEVILRHTRPVDEEYAGSRSQRKNIKSIFIQNADGERFKYPFIHPAGAFAMAQHVDHGGVPHDAAGKAIIKMSENIAQLQEFQGKIQQTNLHDDAMGITERAVGRLNELKARIEALGKRHHYENWVKEFNGREHPTDSVMELDAVTMEQYKQKFTQSSFQEELSGYFPLLHSIMSEENSIELEDYVQESIDGGMGYYVVDRFSKEPTDGPFNSPEEAEQANHNGGGIAQYPIDDIGTIKDGQQGAEDGIHTGTSLQRFRDNPRGNQNLPMPQPVTQRSPDQEFAEWAEAVEQGKLTDDQITGLKQALAQLPTSGQGEPELQLGDQGQTAWQFFSELGIEDTDLEDKLKAAAELDSTSNAFDAFKKWANEDYPELAVTLGISNTAQPEATPQEVGAEQPTAETSSGAGVATVHGIMPAFENQDMEAPPGTMKEQDPKSMVKEVAKIVKSFYNRDNPEVGPFRGQENISLDIKKKISEKFGEQAGQQAEQLATKFMEKLTNEWSERHGKSVNGDDGLSVDRLRELLGNVKAKVEGLGQQETDEGFGSKLLGGAALIAAMWGVNNHMANQAYEASPQLQKLTQFYQQAQANHDEVKMKELERRIENHKVRLDLGYGDVMDKTGNPKEIVPEMADILKLAGLAK